MSAEAAPPSSQRVLSQGGSGDLAAGHPVVLPLLSAR